VQKFLIVSYFDAYCLPSSGQRTLLLYGTTKDSVLHPAGHPVTASAPEVLADAPTEERDYDGDRDRRQQGTKQAKQEF
jgi:hypothetical protein